MKNEGTLPELQEMTDRLLSQELSPLPSVADLQLRNRRRHRRRLAFRSLTVASAAAAVAVSPRSAVPAGDAPSPHWALAGDITSAWRQVPGIGPMSGLSLTCPSASTCYAEGPGSVDPGSVEVTRDGGRLGNLHQPRARRRSATSRARAPGSAPSWRPPSAASPCSSRPPTPARHGRPPGPPGLSGDSSGRSPYLARAPRLAPWWRPVFSRPARAAPSSPRTVGRPGRPLPCLLPRPPRCSASPTPGAFPPARVLREGPGRQLQHGQWAPLGRRPSSLRSPVGPSGLSPFRAVAQRCVWPCRCLTARRGPPLPSPATGASPGRQSRPRGCRQARCSRAWPARPPRCAGCRAIPRCTSPMAK